MASVLGQKKGKADVEARYPAQSRGVQDDVWQKVGSCYSSAAVQFLAAKIFNQRLGPLLPPFILGSSILICRRSIVARASMPSRRERAIGAVM